MSRNPANRYRMDAAEFASPMGLVVQAYDQIIRALREAAAALESGNIELKTNQTNRALLLISHLQSALDHQAGPKVADRLNVFYETMRYQIVKASAQSSGDGLREVAVYFSSLRTAWQTVERETATVPSSGAGRGEEMVQTF
jgi:flagellar biosynthetic protein FliS